MLTSRFRPLASCLAAAALVLGTAAAVGASPATAAQRVPLSNQAAQGGSGTTTPGTTQHWPQTTGERLVGTPTTTPCVETIVKNYAFKNTAYGPDKNYSGPYSPPKACPGPWARVVATIHVHVTGIQFDRIGDIFLGRTDIWAYSTAEPRGDGQGNVVWTKSKDITDYTNLLMAHQRIHYQIGNVVEGEYDGIYYGSLKLTFYPTDSQNPVPPGVPDRVQPVIGAKNIQSGQLRVAGQVTVDQDATTVDAALLVQGHGGCDEFWWADAPPPFPGQCGGPAYREAEVFIDGTLAGIVVPYPYLFTGADGPNWWEPISAPQTMDLRVWKLDLTPFVGLLANGQPHTISVRMLDWSAGSGDFFRVNLALMYDTSGAGQTTGQLTSTLARRHATILQEVTATHYQMQASHAYRSVGWYQVPGGPVTHVTVNQQVRGVSYQNVATGIRDRYGFTQKVRSQQETSAGRAVGPVTVSTTVRAAKLFSLNNGWSMQDSETDTTTDNGAVAFKSVMNDIMTSKLSGGYVSQDHWRYADTTGVCGTTTVTGDNGVITSDHKTPRCVWTPGMGMPALSGLSGGSQSSGPGLTG